MSLCVVHADSFSIQLHISCKCEYVSLFSVYPNSDKHVTDHGQFQQLQLVLFFAFLWIKNIIIIIDQLRQIFFFLISLNLSLYPTAYQNLSIFSG